MYFQNKRARECVVIMSTAYTLRLNTIFALLEDSNIIHVHYLILIHRINGSVYMSHSMIIILPVR